MSQIDIDTTDYLRITKSKKVRPFGLTERELEVIALLQRGLANKQIATELSLTTTTVKHHLSHIFCKVNVANRLQLVVLASEAGLVKDLPDVKPPKFGAQWPPEC